MIATVGYVAAHYTATRPELDACGSALFEVTASGAVKIEANNRYPLAGTEQDHRDLEARATPGSIVWLP